MTHDVQGAIATWKQADADARAAEALLAKAREEFEARRGPAVSDVLFQEVAKARKRANDKLTVALSMIRFKAQLQQEGRTPAVSQGASDVPVP